MNKISELMDGELDEHQARDQFARLKQNDDLARSWRTFHLIGDVLRGERMMSYSLEQRLSARLADEPTVIAPRRITTKSVVAYTLSAAASLSAVALVGWVAVVNNPLVPQPELAKAPNAPIAAPAPAPIASVPSNGRMNEYLLAHQEFSPSTDIQGLAPYIRGVSITQQGQGR